MDSGLLAINVVSVLLFAASGLVFTVGIPVSAYCVYRLNRSRGWYLLAAGFAVALLDVGINLIIVYVSIISSFYFPDTFLLILHMLIIFVGMAVALKGFIMIVNGEDGKNETVHSEVSSCD